MRRLLILTLLAVAGCASTGPQLTVAAPPPDPASLVGWWRVDGTGQVVLVDPAGMEIIDPEPAGSGGLTFTGTWRADPEGGLLIQVDTVNGPAFDVAPGSAPDPVAQYTPEWVGAASAFRMNAGVAELVDGERGAVVARLVPVEPVAGSGVVDPGRPMTDAERRSFEPAAPVPNGLRPVEPGDLRGRWVPEGVGPTASYVEFAEDGTWTGSDGCNGTGGAWQLGSGGKVLATGSAVSTLIACDGMVDVRGWIAETRRAALDGQVLVLLDVDGRTVGRLACKPACATPTSSG